MHYTYLNAVERKKHYKYASLLKHIFNSFTFDQLLEVQYWYFFIELLHKGWQSKNQFSRIALYFFRFEDEYIKYDGCFEIGLVIPILKVSLILFLTSKLNQILGNLWREEETSWGWAVPSSSQPGVKLDFIDSELNNLDSVRLYWYRSN